MERNGWFYRMFFLAFACIASFALLLASSTNEGIESLSIKGLSFGIASFACMWAAEYLLKKISLRTFNTALLGLFIGTLIGLVIASSLRVVLGLIDASTSLLNIVTLYSFLGSVYIGIMLTSSSQEAWWLSIPFVRLAPATQTRKKELILDLTAIEDPRLMELARSGLLDHQLVVPTFVVKEIQKSSESPEENTRLRGRKCQEHLKRLESMPHLDLQIKEFHFSDSEELPIKLARAAKLIQAYILSSCDASQLRDEEEIPTTISLDTIASALKPGAQRGEMLTIKIQRLGKEPKQGVGYLEDGTMVVVNGGGEFWEKQFAHKCFLKNTPLLAKLSSATHLRKMKRAICALPASLTARHITLRTNERLKMIKGIGIDIIEIDRIAKAIDKKGAIFIERLFTRNEQPSTSDVTAHYLATYYAGRFAAKEAVVKALGCGFRGITWLDIEILNDKLGKPYVTLSPEIAKRFDNPQLLLSISHCKSTACASCLWQ